MHEPERALRALMARTVRREARSVTGEWVRIISERLDMERREVLPSDVLLDHIPECLDEIADFVERDERAIPLELVSEHMARLVRLRRSQGFGVHELLVEYEILASLLQDLIERAAAEVDFDVDLPTVAAVVGDLKDAFSQFGVETARFYRIWVASEKREGSRQASTFAAMLRHELHNQVGSAQTAAELLAEDEVNPERRGRLVGLILRGLQQALDTVDIVKGIVADDLDETEQQWLPLPDLLHGLLIGIRHSNLRVEFDAQSVPRTLVPGSAVSMVLLNLIDNAVKYHDDAKEDRWVRVSAEAARVDDDGSQEVRIVVADNGRGIDPALRETILEFSTRGANHTEGGSGLGLALSRDIVTQLGGHIRLDSEPGRGTEVSVVVPARPFASD
ncbi:MAG: ATP-binding protein [Gemmatimonadota bacterium]